MQNAINIISIKNQRTMKKLEKTYINALTKTYASNLDTIESLNYGLALEKLDQNGVRDKIRDKTELMIKFIEVLPGKELFKDILLSKDSISKGERTLSEHFNSVFSKLMKDNVELCSKLYIYDVNSLLFSLGYGLWIYYDEYNEYDISFGLSDDGTDEVEEIIDDLLKIIGDILDYSKEVSHVTYLGYRNLEEKLDQGIPPFKTHQEDDTKLIKLLEQEDVYSEALIIWMREQKEGGIIYNYKQ